MISKLTYKRLFLSKQFSIPSLPNGYIKENDLIAFLQCTPEEFINFSFKAKSIPDIGNIYCPMDIERKLKKFVKWFYFYEHGGFDDTKQI